MSTQITVLRRSRLLSLSTTMDLPADKEERKREYNRLAQREFRRRRKEHLKNLEQAQKEQNSEQSEEIERLRYENDELRRENEVLKTQVYGPTASATHGLLSTPHNMPSMSNDRRAYSLSPSISVASMSGAGSPPSSLGAEMLGLSMTSPMLPPTMSAYADPSGLSDQPYSMVLQQPGVHQNARSSSEIAGYASSQAGMGSSYSSLNIPGSMAPQSSYQAPHAHTHNHRSSSQQGSSPNPVPYYRSKARAEIMEIFRPLLSDPAVTASPERHLLTLRSMSATLPDALKPTRSQLEKHHPYAIDLIPSAALRDRLLAIAPEVAQSFMAEIGVLLGDDHYEDAGQLVVWGDNSALDETAWEFSLATLERWGWMLGREWAQRSSFWRRQHSGGGGGGGGGGGAQLPGW